ncbi:helix-turn-helix transcriptional regulator [Streptomyces millisiae]|uniref:Helix-turn-helix transcriptional regulator n=1 Tax=Streptomyces millisiae TaxID=3075542 RepID=A0ABU2LWF1_9ACTN|nr:helix-turn-helix transcriptional regulator [Streptomyces sp. DSM 44918]MDT0321921.1 helix-turn-helix transcriptional regulator [Streptomyces sp. DSM 44918]
MKRDPRRHDLGEFLKARRAELAPAVVGLPDGGPRRVAGLRREEIAVLAAISTDYYARLEQGRIQPSPSVLESLARVLHLDDDQRAYLYELAANNEFRAPRRPSHPRVQPQLQRMLDDMAHTPAFVIGPRTEIVAWNAMAAALITDFGKIPEKQRYYIRLLITDPAMRDLYADWEGVTRLAIAQMRMHNTNNPGDVRLAALVGELSAQDEQFRRWWGAHDVAVRDTGNKHLRHPVVGSLYLDWNAVTWAADPDLQIIVWTAEPGTPTHDSLRVLASWSADSSRSTRSST